MSLNWQEINLVLKELDVNNSFIQKIKQPDFRTLVLDIYRPGVSFPLLFSLRDNHIRLHSTSHMPAKRRESQRFVQLLRSHIQGGRITQVEHVNNDRIVRFSITHADRTYMLWFRLWGGKANILLTDEKKVIIDAFLRRPQHNESTGEIFSPQPPSSPPSPDRFPVREIPETQTHMTFNEYIDEHYYQLEKQARIQQLQTNIIKDLQKRLAKLRKQERDLLKAQHERDRSDEYRLWGTLLLSNLHDLQPDTGSVRLHDYTGQIVEIPYDERLNGAENADRCFTKAKRAEKSATRTAEHLQSVITEIEQIEQRIQHFSEHPEELLMQEGETKTISPVTAHKAPGLYFRSGHCTILVGRTAAENENLLRRWVRGNDWWLHTRDCPGGYVFIKPPPGKTVPLEVLLDAGNLAVWFSKAKSAAKADLFYTQVKYLKKIKGGKRGLVIPTQEKNITIQIDKKRLNSLLGK